MKNLLPILTVVALAAAPVELQTNSTTPVQPSTSRPLETGFVLKQLPFKIGHPQQAGMPRVRLWESTSGNWSGYAVPGEGGADDTFTAVTGSWVVPAVTGTKGSAAYAATWVGLDGYSSGTVEQTGTLQEWTGTAQANYAWFEMYPNPMYEIEGATVSVGDTITATVMYAGTTTVSAGRGRSETESVFVLNISDGTKWSYTVPQSYTTIPSASRSSAEWVMEAPSSSEILPLADFGSDSFSGCEAISTGSGGLDEPISFWPDADPMTMLDPEDGESVPSVLTVGGTAFTVDWSAYTPPPPARGHGR